MSVFRKKKIKTISSFVLIFVLMFSSITNCFAYEKKEVYDETINLPVSVYNELEIRGYNGLKKITPLYDYNDIIIGYCIDCSNSYMIVDKYGHVIEHSPESNSAFYELDGRSYYGGPLEYIEKKDNHFYNINSNSIISIEDFENCINAFNALSMDLESKKKESNSKGYNIITKKTSGTTRPLNYNTNGSCGPLAFEIMLFYYHDNSIGGISLSSYYVANPGALHSMLVSVYFPSVSTTYTQLMNGINNYFTAYGLNISAVQTISGFMNAIRYRVGIANRPVILRLYQNSSSSSQWSINHWVVAYGYRDYYMNGQLYNTEVIANDGWGHSQVFITYSTTYMNGIVSFNA